jgi:phosphoglucosamine mutase
MAICASDLMSRKKLKKKTLVSTVMSNMGLETAMRRLGGTLVRTQVGDRYVVEEMRRQKYSFGGEQSGHLVFLEHSTSGDGILAALQVLSVMIRENKPISELATIMESFPQVLKNVRTSKKLAIAAIPGFAKQVKHIEEKLGNAGRVLVRLSGTEAVVRVMLEGKDQLTIDTMADELCDLIRQADN